MGDATTLKMTESNLPGPWEEPYSAGRLRQGTLGQRLTLTEGWKVTARVLKGGGTVI